jgi:hypothetical protein
LRSLKLTTRAGLGLCQGRTCGRSVEEILARAGLVDAGRTATRPIALPIRLGELAAAAPGLGAAAPGGEVAAPGPEARPGVAAVRSGEDVR